MAEPFLRNLAETSSGQGSVGWVADALQSGLQTMEVHQAEQGETQHTQPKFLSSIRRRLRRLRCSSGESIDSDLLVDTDDSPRERLKSRGGFRPM
jgi:hypothetical protein